MRKQQVFEGLAGCFADVLINDETSEKRSIFCFCEKKAAEPKIQKIYFTEIGTPTPGKNKHKCSVLIEVPPEIQDDFPILIQALENYGVVFVITKMSYLYIYEISQGVLIYRQKVSK